MLLTQVPGLKPGQSGARLFPCSPGLHSLRVVGDAMRNQRMPLFKLAWMIAGKPTEGMAAHCAVVEHVANKKVAAPPRMCSSAAWTH